MRVIGEIPHPDCKITLYAWNQKYIVKYEKGMFEQTYKISELDITGEAEVREVSVSPEFIEKVFKRFDEMREEWQALFY